MVLIMVINDGGDRPDIAAVEGRNEALNVGHFEIGILCGVEKALANLRGEIERDMKLMGCKSIADLNRDNLRFRR